ncbi:MAG: hypothetical protein IJ778_00030 [Alphaproteobacteria bacterium]|nr:hypothetical protein [Alphaproteobacteria bacterium]
MEKNEIFEAFKTVMPVARKVAMYRMKNEGKTFAEVEPELEQIDAIEARLYAKMKKALEEHIRRHGLDMVSLALFREFEDLECYDKNKVQAILSKIGRAYVHNINNRNLEYLIAKISEYQRKVTDLGKTAYEMIMAGKTPDFDAWSDKMLMQDALYEENKQFLKQALHHLRTLEQNKVKLGVADIRMLMYHRQGCRREKLYHQVEEWIVKIFHELDKEKKQEVFPEICSFLAELVPQVGYISANMVIFVCGTGISNESKDMLLKIHPVITRQGMTPLIVAPLENYYATAVKNLKKGKLTATDENVLEIMQCYKKLPAEIAELWTNLKS